VLKELGWEAISLQEKEGLALLNGTQFSTAYALHGILEAQRLFEWANVCAALSLDAFGGLIEPFDARLHHIRPHRGQQLVAAAVRTWLEDSELQLIPKQVVQDPYAFRCVPQVHGASWDAMQYVARVVETEINGVTDNPNVFPEDDAILSGGNFHAQPLALASDFLAIALSELGSISERRTYQLISGQRGLPAFLATAPGLHSGLMIPQYTAAAIASQNKQLCTPASVDSIVSSNGQEDHVSMAANAGTKLYRVVENVERLLAIEFLTAAQALFFRRPAETSPRLEALLEVYRRRVPPVEHDRVLSADMQETVLFMRETALQV
jgi:histidine ammonia-lyase